jgi:hypothetical protein
MSRYRRMVPQAVRNLIRRSGASKPNWYVGAPPTSGRRSHDPDLKRDIQRVRVAVAAHRAASTSRAKDE